jgi:hypothetical protein
MIAYAYMFTFGFTTGIVVGAYQYGVRAFAKAMEWKP